MSRFDYVPWDSESASTSNQILSTVKTVEQQIETLLPEGRWKKLAITMLEFTWMCVGKAIRDTQVQRTARG